MLAEAVAVPGTVARKVGDAEAALKSAARVVEAEYHVPHLPHLPMEPPVAVARVSGNRCEVWAPTQNPQAAQTEVARVLGTTRTRSPSTSRSSAAGSAASPRRTSARRRRSCRARSARRCACSGRAKTTSGTTTTTRSAPTA